MHKLLCTKCAQPFTTIYRHKRCNDCLRGKRRKHSPGSPIPQWRQHEFEKYIVQAYLERRGITVEWSPNAKQMGYEAIIHRDTQPYVRMSVGEHSYRRRAQIIIKVEKKEGKISITFKHRCARMYVQSRVGRVRQGGGKPILDPEFAWAHPGECFCVPCCFHRFLTGEFDTPLRQQQIIERKEVSDVKTQTTETEQGT